jgi:hypothetical protein
MVIIHRLRLSFQLPHGPSPNLSNIHTLVDGIEADVIGIIPQAHGADRVKRRPIEQAQRSVLGIRRKDPVP